MVEAVLAVSVQQLEGRWTYADRTAEDTSGEDDMKTAYKVLGLLLAFALALACGESAAQS